MNRSIALRNVLLSSLETRLQSASPSVLLTSAENREAERARRELRNEIIALRTVVTRLPDDVFEWQYDRVLSGTAAATGHSPYGPFSPTNVSIFDIHSYDAFIKTQPMWWMPMKEDVARILSTALLLHEDRVARGEKARIDPVEIVDIAGGNGALGTLVCELARKNGINIRYGVVDPMARAVEAHTSDRQPLAGLTFHPYQAVEYLQRACSGNADVRRVVQEYCRLAVDVASSIRDLATILVEGPYAYPRSLAPILRGEFGINTTARFTSPIDLFLRNHEKDLRRLEEVAQRTLRQHPAQLDLVLSSWMPRGVDLSPSMRMMNGAAMIHILDCQGETGILCYDKNTDGTDSYRDSLLHKNRYGWVGAATCQLQAGAYLETVRRSEGYSPWEFWDGLECINGPFANGVLIQVKTNYELELPKLKNHGLILGEPYPWEEDLRSRIGDASPVITVDHDRYGYPSLRDFGERLARERTRERRGSGQSNLK